MTPRAALDRHLQILQEDLLALGRMVEKAIESSIDALKRRDLELSQRVIDEDALVN